MRLAALSILLAVSTATGAAAAEPVEQHNSNAFWFENWRDLSNATLIVASPNGQITEVFAASGTPVFQLSGERVVDGVYRYELSAATNEQTTIVNPVDNGRGDNQRDTRAKPFYTAGYFTVSRGVIITPEEISEDN